MPTIFPMSTQGAGAGPGGAANWWNPVASQHGAMQNNDYYSVAHGDLAGNRFPNQGVNDYLMISHLSISNGSRLTGGPQWHSIQPGGVGAQLHTCQTNDGAGDAMAPAAHLVGLIFPPDTRLFDHGPDNWSAAYYVSPNLADFASMGFDTDNVVPTTLLNSVSHNPFTAVANANGANLWWIVSGHTNNTVEIESDDAGTVSDTIVRWDIGSVHPNPFNRIFIPAGYRPTLQSGADAAWIYELL